MQSVEKAAGGRVVILGCGGTIAGRAESDQDTVGYRAAEIGVDVLVAAVPALRALPLEAEQVAQVDSKDMTPAIWQQLAARVAFHLARPEVAGVVVTHGTDTLEETAYFLHRVLAPSKPLVLTAAMRPATALMADGPQNLLDAVTLARHPGARGVLAVIGGEVYPGGELRKVHSRRLRAFSAGDAGPLGRIDDGRFERWRDWPAGVGLGLPAIAAAAAKWPRVEIVTNHAGADGRIVDALLAQGGVDAIVFAGTGNGTLALGLEAAALRAVAAGVPVLRASRCGWGPVLGGNAALPAAGALSVAQARVELLLRCLISAQGDRTG
ncbi:MAG: asparaginase [Burkholderiales bacterium]|nr:asparaginase [Burkholderiales bacterium]